MVKDKYPRFFLMREESKDDKRVLYRYIRRKNGTAFFVERRNGNIHKSAFSYEELIGDKFIEIEESELVLIV